ncbi:hypothetical protein SALBM311S_06396 [Streptomyces alboniger]
MVATRRGRTASPRSPPRAGGAAGVRAASCGYELMKVSSEGSGTATPLRVRCPRGTRSETDAYSLCVRLLHQVLGVGRVPRHAQSGRSTSRAEDTRARPLRQRALRSAADLQAPLAALALGLLRLAVIGPCVGTGDRTHLLKIPDVTETGRAENRRIDDDPVRPPPDTGRSSPRAAPSSPGRRGRCGSGRWSNPCGGLPLLRRRCRYFSTSVRHNAGPGPQHSRAITPVTRPTRGHHQ